MMQIIKYPDKKDWESLIQRPYWDNTFVTASVKEIINEVKKNKDNAVRKFTKKFDGVELDNFSITEEEFNSAEEKLPNELKAAIQQAKNNISIFHANQKTDLQVIETMPGIKCWRKSVAIEKIGIYIPGGSAPLFSTVLMLGVPAMLAGCKEIILCTPCNKNGTIHPAIIYTAQQVGIKNIFKIGGAQAIAAMAFGTETINAVHKIFGPGNQYVTAAKQLVQMEGISIDMPAGPSEVCVLADDSANPVFIAADLLSQAEHGPDSQVVLITVTEKLAEATLVELNRQVQELPRKEMALQALKNSKAIVMKTVEEAIHLVNAYAPEHLIISCSQGDEIADKIINAGSVFIGNYSPESVGDYASGTNHTLPTNGFAKAYSGVSLDSFVKK
ncbi:MAG TPA: histidinol dehydrogenase, partial [Flavisolibacter sp.]|nr:histidinol dehydrogenase [Flavisolibacter sp.]